MAKANVNHAGRAMAVVGYTTKQTRPRVNAPNGATLRYALLKCPHCGADTERMVSNLNSHKVICFGSRHQTLIPNRAAAYYEGQTKGAEPSPKLPTTEERLSVLLTTEIPWAERKLEVMREELAAAEEHLRKLTAERDVLQERQAKEGKGNVG